MIVLRRKKKILQLFPIGSTKGAVNSRRKPIFYGYLKLKRFKNRIKLSKFIIKNDKEVLLPPKEAIKLLRKQKVFLVEQDLDTEKILENFNIEFKRTKICKHCTIEGYITIIHHNSAYFFQNDYLCRICAEEEIKKELRYKKFDLRTFKNFKRILDITGDLNKVLSIFDPNFNPTMNPDLTLYDKISSKKDEDIQKTRIDEIKISNDLKNIFKREGEYLLPIQSLALGNGLLNGENLLIVSATASGKTLIGEIAGIPKAINGRKFIYLTPLVALANQKYRDFRRKYTELGLKVSIRVGMSRIKAKEEISIVDDDVKNSDVVVGTYEGLDYLLRSGKSGELGGMGTVVIDEIHILDEKERGPRLNGLIKRLKALFPDLQIIGLSATVKNPLQIAEKFKMKLVEYNRRPVPLERHLIFTTSEYEKYNIMEKIAKSEYKNISKKGFHGQSIIFTNSRRKTHSITEYLKKRNVNAAAYHAGLSYAKKNKIEKEFLKQRISTVVTTAALASGVDFPASQVIFETLIMGNKWLTSNEFSQMIGRAGRPSYHDLGKVFLITEVGRKYEDETEDSYAVKLLECDLEPIYVDYSEEDVIEQFLADISSGCADKYLDFVKNYKKIDLPLSIDEAYNILHQYGFIKENNGIINVTEYGRAVSVSFLNYKEAEYIKLNNDLNPLDLAINLEPFENAYISNKINKVISKILKIKLSTRLFADSTLDIISSGELIEKLDPKLRDSLINLNIEFLSCKCKERPFCNCFQKEISKKIINYRLRKCDPIDISNKLMENYQIHSYAGDLFSWLDSLIRKFEAIRRIARAFRNEEVVKESSKLIKLIQN
jgi:putative ATP-dependent RNA helicase